MSSCRHREHGGLNYTESLLHSPTALTGSPRVREELLSGMEPPQLSDLPSCFLGEEGDLGLCICTHTQDVDEGLLNLHDSN